MLFWVGDGGTCDHIAEVVVVMVITEPPQASQNKCCMTAKHAPARCCRLVLLSLPSSTSQQQAAACFENLRLMRQRCILLTMRPQFTQEQCRIVRLYLTGQTIGQPKQAGHSSQSRVWQVCAGHYSQGQITSGQGKAKKNDSGQGRAED